ncbi:MAG: phenylalanine--tRNA ligase subunit beta [Cryomorphaceae bacterium]|nr:phenylalanine--tRNA ligase subunit beta [Cryomorphaceae bacterium]
MKIAYGWLKDYFPTEISLDDAAEILTDIGLEVEGVESFTSIPGKLEGVVVGHVLTCGKHPNADRLSLTTVDIGDKEPVQIVCGAPNVAEGQYVLVATVGCTIYPNEGDPLKIKKGKIRGEVSMGMICAEDELGLGHSHDGIMVLKAPATPGTPASELFPVFNDDIFEIGLTPNRSDAMCHYGVARDLNAALRSRHQVHVPLNLKSTADFVVADNTEPIKITIKDSERCMRYAGLRISGIKMTKSPAWMQARLKSIGLRPINLAVDVTNYVLHETGHPLHAFDAKKISGQHIIIQTLPAGTKLTTLDDVERSLHEDDLCICDEQGPLVLAGVFGGERAEVDNQTTDIFLESALFNPVSVRKTARRHGLNTDASFRYERGVDPEMSIYALRRAALLIKSIGGGKITMNIDDVYPQPVVPREITLRFEKVQALIGKNIPDPTIKEILSHLDIKIKREVANKVVVEVPAYRADVTREADLIEEVLRIYGFNNVEVSGKMTISVPQHRPNKRAQLEDAVSQKLCGRGFSECVNNSLTKSSFAEEGAVDILNPLSSDLGIMRMSLIPGLIENAAFNVNRKNRHLKLFEWGNVYRKTNKGFQEDARLTLLMTGTTIEENWLTAAQESSVFHLSGTLHHLMDAWGMEINDYRPCTNAHLEGGVSLYYNNHWLADIGVIQADLRKKLDLSQDAFVAEINWTLVESCITARKQSFRAIPRYPSVRRDLALVLPEEVKYIDLVNAVQKAEQKLLKSVNLFDVYKGKNIPEGKISYALSFVLQDENKTLTDKQIEKAMQNIQSALEKNFAASLRV